MLLPFQVAGDQGQVPIKKDVAEVAREALWILVAEDDIINNMCVSKMLEANGHRVVAVSNGQEAVEAAAHLKFDAVLLDLSMPLLNGLDAAARIRHDLSQNVPIIALTAHVFEEKRQECLAAGMNDFVSKPFNEDELLSKIYRLVAAMNNRPGKR